MTTESQTRIARVHGDDHTVQVGEDVSEDLAELLIRLENTRMATYDAETRGRLREIREDLEDVLEGCEAHAIAELPTEFDGTTEDRQQPRLDGGTIDAEAVAEALLDPPALTQESGGS